ncbi:hypothetical protein N0V83_007979 [Neocucurbitaria cava]|uniref:Uncharacterized protein n=1 Tax=Neocucurbitaria cava TaxID=798079 RepID=A0A9W9CJR0_9PLEO|nr:hypothetical protein N0V83_007979 [Neocucurbitaria cava]
MSKTWKHFAAFEHTQIGEERDLQGRFLHNAVDMVLATIRTLCDSDHGSCSEIKRLKHFLPNELSAGSAKIVPVRERARGEPDIVFKIAGIGNQQTVGVIGELKFFVTCDVRTQIEKGQKEPETRDSQARGSLRHMFGQVARDMRNRGVRFGFFSTYSETVFLKIILPPGGKPGLLYSEPIKHTTTVSLDASTNMLSNVSIRLGILYLLHRASDAEVSRWQFNTTDIDATKWTASKPNDELGTTATSYNTPAGRSGIPQPTTTTGTPRRHTLAPVGDDDLPDTEDTFNTRELSENLPTTIVFFSMLGLSLMDNREALQDDLILEGVRPYVKVSLINDDDGAGDDQM